MNNEFNELLEEAKHDARIEQLMKFWRAYGHYVIIFLLALAVLGFGSIYWQHRNELKRIESSSLYGQVIDALNKGDTGLAQKTLENLLKEDATGFGLLAEMRLAGDQFQKTQTISDLYQKIIHNKKIDERFRDIALILFSLQTLDKGDPKTIIEPLNALANSRSPFATNAAEVLAFAYIKSNETALAKGLFLELKKNEHVNAGIRLRATAIYEQLNQ